MQSKWPFVAALAAGLVFYSVRDKSEGTCEVQEPDVQASHMMQVKTGKAGLISKLTAEVGHAAHEEAVQAHDEAAQVHEEVAQTRHDVDQVLLALAVLVLIYSCAGTLRERRRAFAGHEAVGGHPDSIFFDGDVVWKKSQEGGRGDVELEVLRWSRDEPSCFGILPRLVGYREADPRTKASAFIGMTNMLSGLYAPSVLDLKMGTRTWNNTADPRKVDRKRSKVVTTTLPSLGVRLVAGKLQLPSGAWEKVGYKNNKELASEEELRDLLARFLCTNALKAAAIEKAQEIHAWWKNQVRYAFYSSSILMAYDSTKMDAIHMHLIDFGNSERITDKSQDLSGFDVAFDTLFRMLFSL